MMEIVESIRLKKSNAVGCYYCVLQGLCGVLAPVYCGSGSFTLSDPKETADLRIEIHKRKNPNTDGLSCSLCMFYNVGSCKSTGIQELSHPACKDGHYFTWEVHKID